MIMVISLLSLLLSYDNEMVMISYDYVYHPYDYGNTLIVSILLPSGKLT